MAIRFRLSLLLLPCALAALFGQTDTGELRLSIHDSGGLPVSAAAVDLSSEMNQYHRTFRSDEEGQVTFKRLPFGFYRVEVRRQGLAPYADVVEIRSAIPREWKVALAVASLQTAVTVTEELPLIDPHRTGTVHRIGSQTLDTRPVASPGRSMLDLVNTQPGWLLEANGILHPRGSEYQTQYVVDGIPLVDIRGPGFVPDFDADDVQSMSILTGGYPAEYGRKLGGVVEVETARDTRPGWHGKAVASGGSFDTGGAYVEGQYGWGRNTATLSANGAHTDRFLDPPVEQNFTNQATTADLTAHYERDLSDSDRIGLIFRRNQSMFLVPNEMVQQEAGQRQDRNSYDTAGQISYTHIFSPSVLADFRGMVRDVSAGLWSNDLATPVIAGQDRSLREGYVKGAVSVHSGSHEIKAGAEGDFGSVREALRYQITDPDQFDPGTAQSFNFRGHAQDREQAVFAQDLVRLRNWTFSAGLRFDHYRLVVDDSAWSPRLGVAYYWPAAGIVFRASYDRIFQTPAFENILVASSAAVDSLSDQVLRLPVRPSHGNFYEGALAKTFFGKVRLDASFYRRDVDNFADDDLLLNTGVSFPISFRKATIQGEEVKLEIPRWGPLSGFVSYSNMHGVGYLPVTGGLFLGSDAASAITETTGSFPDSQDQRNTVQARFRYQVHSRAWAAMGGSYGSGLPVEFDGDPQDAVDAYGQRIVDRVNFERGRVRPNFSLDASAGVLLRTRERPSIRFQVDVRNLTDRLNVINFAGLFSGTALATPRTVSARFQFEF